jgi:hypothetical protein
MLEDSMTILWQEVKDNRKSVCLNTSKEEAYIYRGIKFSKLDGVTRIYNTTKVGLSYREVTKDEYDFLIENGLKIGVKNILQNTYRGQIESINEKIHGEVNTRNNKKHYESLKQKRETLINKYSKLNN